MNLPAQRKPRRSPPSVDLVDPGDSTNPHMPHDRDERVGMTDGKPSEAIKKAHDDVERGVKDTTRAPEADAAYKKLKTGR
ncbi:hypothetical protein [Rhizobacter sp. Root404]|jgi:hypothetical protein|uniref:hypothetical protein n=1 Tax=Rhizobacter sp. Root404 TaxID=1736528 RepID=UPI0006FA0E85|nr:hypothetical protein [Rhizobacter sp. Root404]KQW37445.1 hypothetical protein ASC76_04730 [Rhizobacter sp. Root404]